MAGSSSIQDTFFEECEDLLEALDEGLTEIGDASHSSETVNAVFRAVHSIKGGAGAFGLEDLVGFAHTFETVLDAIRDEKLALDPDLVGVLFKASDHLSDLVGAARGTKDVDADETLSILGALENYLGEDEAEEAELDFQPMTLDFAAEPMSEEPEEQNYSIRFRPHKGLYRNGHDPLFLIQALGELGVLHVELDETDLPCFDSFDPQDSYLAWSMELKTSHPEREITAIFDFVEGLADLEIEVATVAVDTAEQSGTKTETVLAEVPLKQPDPTKERAPETAKVTSKGPKPTLRVDLDRVDRLINAVGELIINHSMLAQRISELDVEDLRSVESELEDFKMLARNIQEGVMSIRAQPVKPLFQRMARIAREASSATGKNTRLVTEGESTEVDKTVVERLSDPLTHIIRNAVDHGIESPEKRTANGKPECGEIHLTAQHRSGSVHIEIRDNGAGLNRSKIRDIAIEKGLIPETADLSDSDIDNLLFMPGFSTASEVSNLSGRGVGMDVVKNAVTSLGGRIGISSTPGQGTTFSIVLPLTLAVMDGMVVTVAGQTMVVPITSIVESLRASEETQHGYGSDASLLSIRGNFVPIVDVAESLGLSVSQDTKRNAIYLLVELENGDRCALAVDAIRDQRQVVVKSLDGVCNAGPGVSAATILGDGKIAMILDPDGIARDLAPPTTAGKMGADVQGVEHASTI